ncbi:MAG: hypothetical protein K6G11_02125 [Lachnospiraceae bacterium]|nr:hypothetical protein [Lachnospiraceae bacterium]
MPSKIEVFNNYLNELNELKAVRDFDELAETIKSTLGKFVGRKESVKNNNAKYLAIREFINGLNEYELDELRRSYFTATVNSMEIQFLPVKSNMDNGGYFEEECKSTWFAYKDFASLLPEEYQKNESVFEDNMFSELILGGELSKKNHELVLEGIKYFDPKHVIGVKPVGEEFEGETEEAENELVNDIAKDFAKTDKTSEKVENVPANEKAEPEKAPVDKVAEPEKAPADKLEEPEKAPADKVEEPKKVENIEKNNDTKKVNKPAVSSDLAEEIVLDFDKADALKNDLVEELEQFAEGLASTQKNAKANFVEKGMTEGSDEYKQMTKSLMNTINKLKNPNTSFKDAMESVHQLWSDSYDYHRAKTGLFGGPHSDSGKYRYKLAGEIRDYVKNFQSKYKGLILDGLKKSKNIEGYSFVKNGPMNQFDDIRENVANKAENENLKKGSEYISSQVNIATNKYKLEYEKTSLLKSLRGKSEFDLENYLGFSPEDNFANTKQLATNYLTKKYINIIAEKNVDIKTIRRLKDEITSGEFDKKVKNIKNNPAFKEMVNKNPDNWYNSWSATEKRMEDLQNKADYNIMKKNSFFKGLDNYVLFHTNQDRFIFESDNPDLINKHLREEAREMKLQNPDRISRNLAEIIVDQMIADPANEKLRCAIYNDEVKKDLVIHTTNYIDNKDVIPFISNNVEDYKPVVQKLLKDSGVKKEIMKSYSEKMKVKENEAVLSHNVSKGMSK